jgi:hypothetical protein
VRGRIALALVALAVGIVAAPLAASPGIPHTVNWAISDNLTPLGFSAREIPLDNN